MHKAKLFISQTILVRDKNKVQRINIIWAFLMTRRFTCDFWILSHWLVWKLWLRVTSSNISWWQGNNCVQKLILHQLSSFCFNIVVSISKNVMLDIFILYFDVTVTKTMFKVPLHYYFKRDQINSRQHNVFIISQNVRQSYDSIVRDYRLKSIWTERHYKCCKYCNIAKRCNAW